MTYPCVPLDVMQVYLLVFMVAEFLYLLIAKLNKDFVKSKYYWNIFIVGSENEKFVVS